MMYRCYQQFIACRPYPAGDFQVCLEGERLICWRVLSFAFAVPWSRPDSPSSYRKMTGSRGVFVLVDVCMDIL